MSEPAGRRSRSDERKSVRSDARKFRTTLPGVENAACFHAFRSCYYTTWRSNILFGSVKHQVSEGPHEAN